MRTGDVDGRLARVVGARGLRDQRLHQLQAARQRGAQPPWYRAHRVPCALPQPDQVLGFIVLKTLTPLRSLSYECVHLLQAARQRGAQPPRHRAYRVPCKSFSRRSLSCSGDMALPALLRSSRAGGLPCFVPLPLGAARQSHLGYHVSCGPCRACLLCARPRGWSSPRCRPAQPPAASGPRPAAPPPAPPPPSGSARPAPGFGASDAVLVTSAVDMHDFLQTLHIRHVRAPAFRRADVVAGGPAAARNASSPVDRRHTLCQGSHLPQGGCGRGGPGGGAQGQQPGGGPARGAEQRGAVAARARDLPQRLHHARTARPHCLSRICGYGSCHGPCRSACQTCMLICSCCQ